MRFKIHKDNGALNSAPIFAALEQGIKNTGFSVVDSFDTVFVVSSNPPIIKKRNLIYRENYNDIHTLTDVDIIIVDFDHSNFIPELTQVWRRTGPAIVVQGPDLISKDIQKILKSDHYNIVEVAKGYYLWKNKK